MRPLDFGRTQRIAWPCLIISAVLAGLTTTSFATSLTWNGTTGNAATSTKWSPQQVPVSADDLFYPGATTFTVTFDSNVPTVNSHTYRNTVTTTLTITSPHTVTNTFSVGTISPDDTTVHLGSGDLSVGGNVSVGDGAGSAGTLTIDGSDASLTITGASSDFFAGRNGTGTVSVIGGGLIEAGDDFIIGAVNGGSGDVTVTGGSGSLPNIVRSQIRTASATGDIFVGNSGNGTLHLLNGGFAHSAHDVKVSPTSGHTGSIDLSGSFSIFGSGLTVDHNLDISRNDSAVLAGGTSSVTITSPSLVNVTNLTRVGDPQGGSGTLTLAGSSETATVITSTGGFDVQPNGTITGVGKINGDITNLGSITPTGAGMTITGILTNTTNNVSGTAIHFSGTGGYSGSGTCQADISGDATTSITATGTLSIGANTATGFFYLGTLDVGGNIVTLNDANGAVVGGLATINSGRIEAPHGLGLQNGGTLQGDGLFVADLTASGVIDPHTNNTLGGLFTVQGDLIMNPSSEFDMEIGGDPASSNNDRMNVSGTLNFVDTDATPTTAGTIRVRLKNGFVPRVGQQFIAINATAGRLNDSKFQTLISPSPAPCNEVTFVMVYSATAAIVLVRPPLGCTALGDLNSDGSINGKDIQLFVNDLLNPTYQSCADMDGDCQDNVSDIAVMLNALL